MPFLSTLFPPAPWHLRGWGIATLQTVDVSAARRCVPAGCDIIAIAPGKTVGGLLFLAYESGSTLEYRELNVVAALVRVGLRPALYLARLYVDNPASQAGGRAIWGVPKVAGTFEVAKGEIERSVCVTSGGVNVCRLRVPGVRRGPRVTLPLPAVGVRADRFLFFTGRLSACVRVVRATVEFAPGGECGALALDRPAIGFSLDACDLVVPAPKAVSRGKFA